MEEYVLSHQNIWGAAIIFVIYVLAIVVIVRDDDSENAHGRTIGMLSIFTIIVAYFPLTYMIIHKGVTTWACYLDINGLLLLPWVIPFGMMIGFRRFGAGKKALGGVLLSLFLLCMWNWGRRLPDWERGLNWYYRIPDETIAIGDYIAENERDHIESDKENTIPVAIVTFAREDDSDNIRLDEYAKYQYGIGRALRQYVSPIQIMPMNYTDVNMMDTSVLEEYRYVVCANNDTAYDKLLVGGMSLIMDYDDYAVFKNDRE